MCGRFRQSRSRQILEEMFQGHFDSDDDFPPRFNIAPTQPVLAIRQEPDQPIRRISLMRWGLVPSWSKDLSGSARMINARSEAITTTPAFREPFKTQRCLIPADGFYEWKSAGKTKQPYCFQVGHGELFAFAGLWDKWRSSNKEIVESCTLITTIANPLVADIHGRMPVILDPDNYDLWLDPGFHNSDTLSAMFVPYDASFMERYAVSNRVSDPKNDDAECAAPDSPKAIIQRSLF
jgi:putative SOS response-associated peptidase YedK